MDNKVPGLLLVVKAAMEVKSEPSELISQEINQLDNVGRNDLFHMKLVRSVTIHFLYKLDPKDSIYIVLLS